MTRIWKKVNINWGDFAKTKKGKNQQTSQKIAQSSQQTSSSKTPRTTSSGGTQPTQPTQPIKTVVATVGKVAKQQENKEQIIQKILNSQEVSVENKAALLKKIIGDTVYKKFVRKKQNILKPKKPLHKR